MNFLLLCFTLLLPPVIHAQKSCKDLKVEKIRAINAINNKNQKENPPIKNPVMSLSQCRKEHFRKQDKTEFLKCARTEDFYMEKWDVNMKKEALVRHLKDAVDFVDLKGGVKLLSIGMLGEGIAVKDKNNLKEGYKNVNESNFESIAEKHLYNKGYVQAPVNSEKWIGPKSYLPAPIKTELVRPKHYYEKPTYKKGDWVLTDKTNGTFSPSPQIGPRVVMEAFNGEGFHDDGTDTFGLEYNCLRKLGLIPNEFCYGNRSDPKLNSAKLSEMPHFVFAPLDDPDRWRNEPAGRFSPNYNTSGIKAGDTCYEDIRHKDNPKLYKNKLTEDLKDFKQLIIERKGDPGRTFYKTPEAQVFASAALWKLSQMRLEAFKNELKIEREFSEDEMFFWSKAFFNGAQGTQAGAFEMLKSYKERGLLNNENYLKNWPGGNPEGGFPNIYFNARLTLEMIKQTPKECFAEYPGASTRKYTKVSEIMDRTHPSPTPSDKNNSKGKSVSGQ